MSETQKQDKPQTHEEFARSDGNFRFACEQAGVPPTRRQASKWRRKEGLAYKKGRTK